MAVFRTYPIICIVVFAFLVVGAFALGYFFKPNIECKTEQKIDYTKIGSEFIRETIKQNKSVYYDPADEKNLDRETPADLREYIVRYLCNDPNPYDFCVGKIDDEFGDLNMIETDVVDLNDDGQKEYIVMPVWMSGFPLRGASGNGSILVMRKKDDKWEIIGDLFGNGYVVTNEKTDNYHDILTNSHNSAFSSTKTLYQFYLDKDNPAESGYIKLFAKEYSLPTD